MIRKLKENCQAYAQYVGMVVAVLVVILVGITIFYKISGSITGLPADGVTALAGVNSTASTVFSLMPVTALVLIAAIIIGVIIAFSGNRKA